jgi:endonuclease/exonuclease/phosphatase family metal-dependent hydrolase
MKSAWVMLAVVAGGAALLAAACGGDDDATVRLPATSTPDSITPTATAQPDPPPTEFRVAFINLMSPISLDETNSSASDTFDDRLSLIIADLKEFKPDLVAVNEATRTTEHGSVEDRLVRELKMETQYVTAKPWYIGLTNEQNADIASKVGFEEGELILVRSDRFPILEAERTWLNPRTSEAEGPAALHVRVKGPPSMGEIDVFLSHLTGADSKVRAQQATSLAQFIRAKKGGGPTIVMGDFGDPAGTATQRAFLDVGMTDVLAESGFATCCRESVVGEQPPLQALTDYLLTSQWLPSELAMSADKPETLADGTVLYASDHNGVTAVFPIGPSPGP